MLRRAKVKTVKILPGQKVIKGKKVKTGRILYKV